MGEKSKGEVPAPDIPALPYPGPPLEAYPVQPTIQTGVYSTNSVQLPDYMYPPQPLVIQPAQQAAYMYPPQQRQVAQPVNQVVVTQSHLSDVPGQTLCPYCQITVITKTEYKNGMLTWLICGILALFLCCLCSFIPFCVNACKDVEHTCPACNRVLHLYKHI